MNFKVFFCHLTLILVAVDLYIYEHLSIYYVVTEYYTDECHDHSKNERAKRA